jgi:hypothetical protein
LSVSREAFLGGNGMNSIVCRLTVFFEDPFWVGVYERNCDGKLEAARIVFGAEPKDYEVYELMLNRWGSLAFSPPVHGSISMETILNPKRRQREAQKLLSEKGAGTKAQQALKLQHEQNAAMRKADAHERTEEEKERQFELRQQKRKEKHRGH